MLKVNMKNRTITVISRTLGSDLIIAAKVTRINGILESIWKPACRILARLEEGVAVTRKQGVATQLTENGAMTLQILTGCETLVAQLGTKTDALLGAEGGIASALAGDAGASLQSIENSVRNVFSEGEDGGDAQSNDTLSVLITQLKLKVSLAEQQVSGIDGGSGGKVENLWKTRLTLPGIAATSGDVSVILGAAHEQGQTPWEKRAAKIRTQLVEAALLPAKVKELEAELARSAAVVQEKQEVVMKADYLRSKLETRLQSEISKVVGEKEAAEARILDVQREAEAAAAKDKKQLDLAKAKNKRLDDKYKTVMKELRALKRAGGNTASPAASPRESEATSPRNARASPGPITKASLKHLAVSTSAAHDASDTAPSKKTSGSRSSGSGDSRELEAALDFTRQRRNTWKRIALQHLGTSLPELPRVIPASAADRNLLMHPGLPTFCEDQEKIRAQ